MNRLNTGDKVRFKKGAFSILKVETQVESQLGGHGVQWRLDLEGLIGEVWFKHPRPASLQDLYRVRVRHLKSGIMVIDDFDWDEIEGPLVEAAP